MSAGLFEVIFGKESGCSRGCQEQPQHVSNHAVSKGVLGNGTSHPSLSLLPSGNFFLALNRNHHFLKKNQNLVWQLQYNDNFTLLKILRTYSKVIKFESLCWSCRIKFWLFWTKNDDFYLKPKRNSRMAKAWDQAKLSPCFPNISQ